MYVHCASTSSRRVNGQRASVSAHRVEEQTLVSLRRVGSEGGAVAEVHGHVAQYRLLTRLFLI